MLAETRKELQYFTTNTILRECKLMSHIPFSSQVMMKSIKYRAVLKFYRKIHSIPTLNFSETPFEEIMELKNIDRLYEYFCFFKLDEIISNISDDFRRANSYFFSLTIKLHKYLTIRRLAHCLLN